MKKTSSFTKIGASLFLVAIFAAVAALTAFVGCKENKNTSESPSGSESIKSTESTKSPEPSHNFSQTFAYDSEYHYRICSDAGCSETTDKEKHVFGKAEIITEPTADMSGLRKLTCEKCGYEKNETMPAAPMHPTTRIACRSRLRWFDSTTAYPHAKPRSWSSSPAATPWRASPSSWWFRKTPSEPTASASTPSWISTRSRSSSTCWKRSIRKIWKSSL